MRVATTPAMAVLTPTTVVHAWMACRGSRTGPTTVRTLALDVGGAAVLDLGAYAIPANSPLGADWPV